MSTENFFQIFVLMLLTKITCSFYYLLFNWFIYKCQAHLTFVFQEELLNGWHLTTCTTSGFCWPHAFGWFSCSWWLANLSRWPLKTLMVRMPPCGMDFSQSRQCCGIVPGYRHRWPLSQNQRNSNARGDLGGHGVRFLHAIEVQERGGKGQKSLPLQLPWAGGAHFSLGDLGGLFPVVPFSGASAWLLVWEIPLFGVIMRCCLDRPASLCSSWCCVLVTMCLKVTFSVPEGRWLKYVLGSLFLL